MRSRTTFLCIRSATLFHNACRFASHMGTSAQRPVYQAPVSGYIDQKDYESDGFRANFQPRREFYDEDKKYCKLCQESVPDYRQHCVFHVYHAATVALVQSIMNANHQNPATSPRDIVNSWWPKLRDHRAFFRIKELSSDNQEIRKKKLGDLLLFLKKNRIIKHTFSCLIQQGGNSYVPHRTVEFDRFEWIGDNIMKKLFYERIELIGRETKTSYHWFLSFIMGNEPLHDAYGAFSFDKIILDGIGQGARVVLPVSKMKADIVEALLGELQVNIWVTQTDVSNDYVSYPAHNLRNVPVHHLLFHALHETVTVMIMEILQKILHRAWGFIEKLKKRPYLVSNVARTVQRYIAKSPKGDSRPTGVNTSVYDTQTSPASKQSKGGTVHFPYFNLHDPSTFYSQASLDTVLRFSKGLASKHSYAQFISPMLDAVQPKIDAKMGRAAKKEGARHPTCSSASRKQSVFPVLLDGPYHQPIEPFRPEEPFSADCSLDISQMRGTINGTEELVSSPYHCEFSSVGSLRKQRFSIGKLLKKYLVSDVEKRKTKAEYAVDYPLHHMPRLRSEQNGPCDAAQRVVASYALRM